MVASEAEEVERAGGEAREEEEAFALRCMEERKEYMVDSTTLSIQFWNKGRS